LIILPFVQGRTALSVHIGTHTSEHRITFYLTALTLDPSSSCLFGKHDGTFTRDKVQEYFHFTKVW
jgi:hypothetical protein